MRVLSIIALSILIAACKPNRQKMEATSKDPPQRLSLREMQDRFALRDKRSEDVLVREVTPFDSDVAARKAYLESFYRGYQLGIGGTNQTCCFVDDPHHKAIVTGWYDGQWAGNRVSTSNHLDKFQ